MLSYEDSSEEAFLLVENYILTTSPSIYSWWEFLDFISPRENFSLSLLSTLDGPE